MGLIVSFVILFLPIGASDSWGAGTAPSYSGQRGVTAVMATGCNATAYAPVPGRTDLFIGRQFFTVDHSPLLSGSGCSKQLEPVRNIRFGLVIARLDWPTRQFIFVKPLLAPPFTVPSGPFRGAIIRAAYDPDIVAYDGQFVLAFECILANKALYGVQGTSSCLAVYDPATQTIKPGTVRVVISAERGVRNTIAYSASVPHLLVWRGRLFLYYSVITIDSGRFLRVGVRGVELAAGGGSYQVKGLHRLVYAMQPPTVEVWAPVPSDPMSDTAVDVRSVWARDGRVFMLAGLGGGGCAKPGPQRGCFRMALAETSVPLGSDIFNGSSHLSESALPSNPAGYVRLIRSPSGQCMVLGEFFKPVANGYSELRPAQPTSGGAGKPPLAGTLMMFPFSDTSWCPSS